MRSLPALLLALTTLAVALPAPALAAGEGEELDALGHSSDGFYLDFLPFGKIELPRVFLVRDADGGLGLDVFGSTKKAVASGLYAAEAIPYAEEPGTVLGELPEESGQEFVGDEVHTTIGGHPAEAHAGDEAAAGYVADPLYTGVVRTEGEVIADLSFTRHTVFLFVSALILLLLFLPLGAKYRRGVGRETAPQGRKMNAMEVLVLYVREEIAKPTMGDKYPKFMPYLLTAFFFIFFSNLLGLLPYSATITSNIAVTAVLATFTFVITQINGSKDYWAHIFNPPGVPPLVKIIMVPVEILGIFTKPFALAIRLFANMTAGHLIILSLIGLIFTFTQIFGAAAGWGTAPVSVAMATFVYILELLIAFIQAYVFTILSALFIGMAVAEHEHHGHEDHGDQTPHERAIQSAAPVVAGNGVYYEEEKTVGTEAAMAMNG